MLFSPIVWALKEQAHKVNEKDSRATVEKGGRFP